MTTNVSECEYRCGGYPHRLSLSLLRQCSIPLVALELLESLAVVLVAIAVGTSKAGNALFLALSMQFPLVLSDASE